MNNCINNKDSIKTMFDNLREDFQDTLNHWEDIKDDEVMDFPLNRLPEAIKRSDSFKLYRYTPADYFNIRNIETQTIHLSPNGVMNDIYEGLPITESKINYHQLECLNDLAVMTCFSESNDNTLMWSHYADSHRGFCVEYDIKAHIDNSCAAYSHLFPIIYTQNRYIKKNIEYLIESHYELKKAIQEDYVYDSFDPLDDILPLFLTKGSEWEYEREWRIIYTKKQIYDIDNEDLYKCNLSFPCISSIYLGYRIHPEVRQNIIEICNRITDKKVSVFQAELEENSYKIKFKKIH